MIEHLSQIDMDVLHFLNVTCADPRLDVFWGGITRLHKLAWVRLGVFPAALFALLYIYKWHALKLVLALGLAIALSDILCYRGVKSLIQRPRPFQNAEISSWVRKAGEAHGPSFPSNHAANCFAGAAILAWYFRRKRFYFYSFAVLVALSRPALGVHYPSDVLAGAMLGFFVAWLVIALVLNRFRFFRLPLRVSDGDWHSGDWRTRSRRLS